MMRDKRVTLFIPVACAIAFFLGFENGGFQLILVEIAQSFNLDNVMMGVLVASQYSAITAGPLLFGWAADRYGKKTLLLIFVPVFALGCFGAAFAGTVLLFLSAVFVTGIGYSVSECISSSAVSDSFPGKESKYLNFMQCFFGLGAVVSPQIFSRLMNAGIANWRTVFLSAGIGYVLLYPLLCLSRCRPSADFPAEIPSTRTEHAAVESPVNHDEISGSRTVPTNSFESKLISPLLFVLLAAMVAYVAMETGIGFFANAIFVSEYANTELGAYAISGFWLAMTVSRFIFALIKMEMRNMILLGFAASFLLMIILSVYRDQWVLMAIFVLLGAVLAPVWPMIIGIGTSSFREKSGTVAGILAASGGFGGALIPVLIGWISVRTGFYGGFQLLTAVSAIGFLIMWFGKKR